MIYTSKSAEKTAEIAKNLAKTLSPCVVLLRGDLGAGKTVFAKGFVNQIVPRACVVSPTFAIMNSYEDTVFHFDLYRIESEGELDAFGASEYFFSGKFCLVEWPQRVDISVFPKKHVEVVITKIDEKTRRIEILRGEL